MAKILVVDDAEFLRVRISKVLTGSGHQVIEADNGVTAVNAYSLGHPDAVLLDITMPEMDGLAALKQIRANDPNARVVMLTALGQESIVLEAIKFGAKDFVVKPFQPERVLAAIDRALAA
jgi:two-component system chemotaxis response regulator CheY